MEIVQYKEKLKKVEDAMNNIQKELDNKTKFFIEELENCKKERKEFEVQMTKSSYSTDTNDISHDDVRLYIINIQLKHQFKNVHEIFINLIG